MDVKPRRREPRERLGREEPVSVLRGPPITITCECGEKRNLRYGEHWRCERCGKRWDTRQIPAEQYDAIRRLQCAPAAVLLFCRRTTTRQDSSPASDRHSPQLRCALTLPR